MFYFQIIFYCLSLSFEEKMSLFLTASLCKCSKIDWSMYSTYKHWIMFINFGVFIALIMTTTTIPSYTTGMYFSVTLWRNHHFFIFHLITKLTSMYIFRITVILVNLCAMCVLLSLQYNVKIPAHCQHLKLFCAMFRYKSLFLYVII